MLKTCPCIWPGDCQSSIRPIEPLSKAEAPEQFSTGVILSFGTSFVIFDIWEYLETSLVSHMGVHVEGVLLASNEQRPRMLTSYHTQDSAHNKEFSSPKCHWCCC